MASKCFCDACGAEMPKPVAVGVRVLDKGGCLVAVFHVAPTINSQSGAYSKDVCANCICKAFAALLDEPKPCTILGRVDCKVLGREPTDAMIDAGRKEIGSTAGIMLMLWRAMYDAA